MVLAPRALSYIYYTHIYDVEYMHIQIRPSSRHAFIFLSPADRLMNSALVRSSIYSLLYFIQCAYFFYSLHLFFPASSLQCIARNARPHSIYIYVRVCMMRVRLHASVQLICTSIGRLVLWTVFFLCALIYSRISIKETSIFWAPKYIALNSTEYKEK